MRKKILYIVSNLRRTGPVNQLFFIISNLDLNEYDPQILTLSPEPVNSRVADFENFGIEIDSLNLTRVKGLISGRKKLRNYIRHCNPYIVQTQGVRADALLAREKLNCAWITTARNFPIEDYPSKFGLLLGRVMAYHHLRVLGKCKNLVSCSQSIADKLKSVKIHSRVIKNGVEVKDTNHYHRSIGETLNLVSVGSLIPRKNMSRVIELSIKLTEIDVPNRLIILGEGQLMDELKKNAPNYISFLGQVENVKEFLESSDVFISTSKSEGLPNTVLEAASCGIPLVLSNIAPHDEICISMPTKSTLLVSNDTSIEDMAMLVKSFINNLSNVNSSSIVEATVSNFGHVAMSINYQDLYKEAVI